MKKKSGRIISLCIIAVILMPVLWKVGFPSKVYAGYVQKPDSDTIGLEETVTIQLTGDGLKDIYGYEVTIEYQPDEFTFVESVSKQEGGMDACNKQEEGVILYTRVGEAAEGLPAEGVWSEFVFKAVKEGEAVVDISLRTMDVDYGFQEQEGASFVYKVESGSEDPSESPSPSPGTSPSESPSPSPGTSPSESPSPSPGTSPSESPSPGTSPSESPSPSPGTSPSESPSPGTSPSENPSPSPSPSPSESTSPSPSISPSESESPSPSLSPSPGESPSESESPSPSISPSESESPSPSISPNESTSPIPGESTSESPSPSESASPNPGDGSNSSETPGSGQEAGSNDNEGRVISPQTYDNNGSGTTETGNNVWIAILAALVVIVAAILLYSFRLSEKSGKDKR